MNPKKLLTSVTVLGTGHFSMALIFLGSVSIPFLETMCPRYLTHNLKNSHLLGLSLKPAAVSFSNTPFNRSICSSGILENTIMLSRYIIHHFRCISPRQVSIKHWNVASALVKPKASEHTRKIPRVQQ